ncbi:hypothetical protein [Salinirubrum litoreum]|uniref:Uncharacterized protein n=1 Tax=Salinirubrum litoreum TaxID=1126234 RepID=A0ABD5R7I7_9EURY|nr:hypothetical protein [Salinirubrum litoreum]
MSEPTTRRYPVGSGLLAGVLLGGLLGLVAWWLSGRVVFGLLLTVAVRTALGVTFERSLPTRPQTPTERLVVLLALLAGLLVFLSVLVGVGLLD